MFDDVPKLNAWEEYQAWIEDRIQLNITINHATAPPQMKSPAGISIVDGRPQITVHDNRINSQAHETQVVIHEICHIYLWYVQRFPYFDYRNNPTEPQIDLINAAVTLVADAAVNLITQQIGYPIDFDVREMIQTAEFLRAKPDGHELKVGEAKEKALVYKYIYSWLGLQYLDLTGEERGAAQSFCEAVEQAVPTKLLVEIMSIRDCAAQCDAFSAEGSLLLTNKVLELWHLESFAIVRTI